MTCTGQSSATAAAATCADCIVAERCDERLMHTMPVGAAAPAARGTAPRTRPADGAAVSGSAVGVLEPLPELVGAELHAVDELLVAEADGERDDLDAERVDERLRQIAAAVGDHPDAHACAPDRRSRSVVDALIVARFTARRSRAGTRARIADSSSTRSSASSAEVHRAADRRAERRPRGPPGRSCDHPISSPTAQLTPPTTTPAATIARERRRHLRAVDAAEADVRARTRVSTAPTK